MNVPCTCIIKWYGMGVIKQSGFMVYHTSTSLTSPAGDKKCGLLQSDLVRL